MKKDRNKTKHKKDKKGGYSDWLSEVQGQLYVFFFLSLILPFTHLQPQAQQNDSESTVSAPDFTPTSTKLMGVDGTIVLGQDQDAPAAVYDATQSFR